MVNRVLVTGASGFIGQHVVRSLLLSGTEVVATARNVAAARSAEPDAEWIEANLFDPEAASRVAALAHADSMLHLAWDVSPGYWTSSGNLDWLAASLRLARAFGEHGGTRIVTAGTCAEYDWSAGIFESNDINEANGPFAPTTLYARTKLSLREVLTHWSRENGLTYAAGLLFFIFGPREHPSRLVPSVIDDLLTGRTVRVSSGYQVRDYLDVRDAGCALAILATGSVQGPVNIGAGRGHSIRGIVSVLQKALAPSASIEFGTLPDRPGDPPRLVADISRLADEVGFTPTIELTDGLLHCIEYWKQERQG